MPDRFIVDTGAYVGEDLLGAFSVPGGVTFKDAQTDSDRDPVSVTCEQAAYPVPHPPKPRYNVVDRPGQIGVAEWAGQDPYELELTVRLDRYPLYSVEPQIAILEGFAEVPPGRSEPPIIKVTGAIPRPHPNLLWRMTEIDPPSEQQMVQGGQDRCRYVTRLTLTQAVTGATIAEALLGAKASKGIRVRTTTVRQGELDLFAVARRYYHDPSRASDIARANFSNGRPLALGGRLKPGTKLRMPS